MLGAQAAAAGSGGRQAVEGWGGRGRRKGEGGVEIKREYKEEMLSTILMCCTMQILLLARVLCKQKPLVRSCKRFHSSYSSTHQASKNSPLPPPPRLPPPPAQHISCCCHSIDPLESRPQLAIPPDPGLSSPHRLFRQYASSSGIACSAKVNVDGSDAASRGPPWDDPNPASACCGVAGVVPDPPSKGMVSEPTKH